MTIHPIAFPPRLQRCVPERTCRQTHCARRDPSIAQGKPIDGTVIHVGRFCPLFVDARHPMLEAA